MRTERQGRMRRRARGHLVGTAALVLLLSAVLASAAGAAPRVRHSCHAPSSPTQARCLAMRLLVEPAASAGTLAAPLQGRAAGQASKPFPGFQTPQRLREAYGLPDETAAGSTQTVAVVDAYDDPTAEADLGVYSRQFGLPECTTANGCFKKVNQKGTASPLPEVEGGWGTEISIDVQMAHAVCQTCHILLVETNTEEFSDLAKGVNAAVSLGATEVSNSYGAAEDSSLKELESTSFNHPGIVITASSGDCGYLNSACPEVERGAEFPADSPHVVAVGGTSLHESGGVWSASAWNEGGSGCSVLFSAPFWQSAVANFAATGCGSGRAIADVSAVGDPETGVDVYDSTPEFPGEKTGWGVWGGTSVSSPIVAAEFALAGGSQGVSYPTATLYGHAGEASSFYDVPSGSNGTCAKKTICEAVAGYDGPTGLGSPTGLGAFAVSGTPKSTSPPTISGYTEQGLALEAHHGGWTGSPSSFSYQWERCGFGGENCMPIAGQTASTYAATGEDVGHQIRVREGAVNGTGSGWEDSATVGPVASNLPTVTSFTPASGFTGSTVQIKGTALDSTTQVQFGGLSATFTVVSPTLLEATVPNGAKKAKLTVTTAHGSVTPKAKFLPTFGIASFSPLSAAAGAKLSIKGEGFTPSSSVSFNGVPAAAVTYVSAKKLKVIVPAGAAGGPISVTNETPPGTVTSAQSFTP